MYFSGGLFEKNRCFSKMQYFSSHINVFFIIQASFNPYLTNRLNYIEINLIVTIFMTVLLGDLYQTISDAILRVLLTVGLVFLNIQFLISILRIIIVYQFHQVINSRLFKFFDCFGFFRLITGEKIFFYF